MFVTSLSIRRMSTACTVLTHPFVALGYAGEEALETLSLGEISSVLKKKANSTAVNNNALGGAHLKPGKK